MWIWVPTSWPTSASTACWTSSNDVWVWIKQRTHGCPGSGLAGAVEKWWNFKPWKWRKKWRKMAVCGDFRCFPKVRCGGLKPWFHGGFANINVDFGDSHLWKRKMEISAMEIGIQPARYLHSTASTHVECSTGTHKSRKLVQMSQKKTDPFKLVGLTCQKKWLIRQQAGTGQES